MHNDCSKNMQRILTPQRLTTGTLSGQFKLDMSKALWQKGSHVLCLPAEGFLLRLLLQEFFAFHDAIYLDNHCISCKIILGKKIEGKRWVFCNRRQMISITGEQFNPQHWQEGTAWARTARFGGNAVLNWDRWMFNHNRTFPSPGSLRRQKYLRYLVSTFWVGNSNMNKM